MLIRRQQVEDLSRLEGRESLITSCYLNTGGSLRAEKEYLIALKEMVRGAKDDLEGRSLAAEVRQSALEDLERIRVWVENEFERKGANALALFACSASGLWQVFPLPRRLPNRLVQDQSPYIRPLTVILDQHPRFCVVVVDRERARIFEVCLGEIEETTEVLGDVPDQVRFGGWKGYEEKRVARSIEDKVHRHYRQTAEKTLDVFRRDRFDLLVVGGYREALNEFSGHLHSYLQERLRAKVELDPAAPPGDILKRVREVEKELEREQEQDLIKRLVTEARKNGAAVLGLDRTLEALHRGAVHTLVVVGDRQASGHRCRECGRMSVDGGQCPSCRGTSLVALPHLIDEAIEEALIQGGEVEHTFDAEGLEGDVPLAATLRFRLGP